MGKFSCSGGHCEILQWPSFRDHVLTSKVRQPHSKPVVRPVMVEMWFMAVRIVFQRKCQPEDEVQQIRNSQCSEISIGRAAHASPGQHDDSHTCKSKNLKKLEHGLGRWMTDSYHCRECRRWPPRAEELLGSRIWSRWENCRRSLRHHLPWWNSRPPWLTCKQDGSRQFDTRDTRDIYNVTVPTLWQRLLKATPAPFDL